MSLSLATVELSEANAFVAAKHRHSKPVVGHKFSVAVADRHGLRGVAIAGRPVARMLQDGRTIEIYRVCTDGARNACTMLYGACCRAAAALGYLLAITYTLASENGASLRAAGFRPVAEVKDGQWHRPSRPAPERDLIGDKVRWERVLARPLNSRPAKGVDLVSPCGAVRSLSRQPPPHHAQHGGSEGAA